MKITREVRDVAAKQNRLSTSVLNLKLAIILTH
jgi:hypothetical protein